MNDKDLSSSDQPSMFSIVGSVLSSVIGIQSREKLTRDFKGGSVMSYLIVGLLFVILFVMAIIFLAKYVAA